MTNRKTFLRGHYHSFHDPVASKKVSTDPLTHSRISDKLEIGGFLGFLKKTLDASSDF